MTEQLQPDLGRRFGVDALLEGSVRKSADRLRITVQLIDVDSGYHRWSQRFERNVGDVFAVQDEIAEAVAMTLRGGALSRANAAPCVAPKQLRNHTNTSCAAVSACTACNSPTWKKVGRCSNGL